eukprot:365555-Chlamydomonas_euryale.AAC.2
MVSLQESSGSCLCLWPPQQALPIVPRAARRSHDRADQRSDADRISTPQREGRRRRAAVAKARSLGHSGIRRRSGETHGLLPQRGRMSMRIATPSCLSLRSWLSTERLFPPHHHAAPCTERRTLARRPVPVRGPQSLASAAGGFLQAWLDVCLGIDAVTSSYAAAAVASTSSSTREACTGDGSHAHACSLQVSTSLPHQWRDDSSCCCTLPSPPPPPPLPPPLPPGMVHPCLLTCESGSTLPQTHAHGCVQRRSYAPLLRCRQPGACRRVRRALAMKSWGGKYGRLHFACPGWQLPTSCKGA